MMVTLAIVPRERYSFARPSLENILANTRDPFDLVYVDGGSPPDVRDYLAGIARERGFKLIRTEYILSPNEARNLAIPEVKTKYVVFVDNDITVAPGWLEKLVSCAEETRAAIVGPLYMIGPPGTDVIHMAGGDMIITEEDGKRVFVEEHRLWGRRLGSHAHEIRREMVDMVEFHTMLVRRDLFDTVGLLDEEYMSAYEHIDLCLQVRDLGEKVYLEPDAKVTYTPSRPKGEEDRAFFLLRWSTEWNRRSMDRFAEKWRIDRNCKGLRGAWRWLSQKRRSHSPMFGLLDPLLHSARTKRDERRREDLRPQS